MSITSIAADFNAGTIGGGEAVQQAMAEGLTYDQAVASLTSAITSSTPSGVTYSGGYAVQPAAPPVVPPVTPPPTPVKTPETIASIIARYKAGGYGSVGSASAKDAAIIALKNYWVTTGLGQDAAFAKATQTFNEQIPSGKSLSDRSTSINEPKATADLRRELPFSTQFQAFLNERMPQIGYGPLRGYVEQQGVPLENLYQLGQQYRDLPDEVTFPEYLARRSGGIGRPDPREFADYARRGAAFLTGPATNENFGARDFFGVGAGLSDEQRETGQQRQFNLAVAGAEPDLAREVRPALTRAARSAYDTFRYNQPGDSFLPYLINRGYNFFK